VLEYLHALLGEHNSKILMKRNISKGSARVVVHGVRVVMHSARVVVHSAMVVVHSAMVVVHSARVVVHSARVVVHSAWVVVHSSRVVVHSARVVVHSSRVVCTVQGLFCLVITACLITAGFLTRQILPHVEITHSTFTLKSLMLYGLYCGTISADVCVCVCVCHIKKPSLCSPKVKCLLVHRLNHPV
jgi:hypothetical protein